MGILDVIIPMLYGEGEERASRRLREEVDRRHTKLAPDSTSINSGNARKPVKLSYDNTNGSGLVENDYMINGETGDSKHSSLWQGHFDRS
jgi:hypothetical protein